MKGLVTFSSSHTAMEAELLCEDAAMSCRLIPLPASISAGCGLALLFPWQMKTQVEDLLTSNSLHLEGVYQEAGKSWKAASMGKQ